MEVGTGCGAQGQCGLWVRELVGLGGGGLEEGSAKSKNYEIEPRSSRASYIGVRKLTERSGGASGCEAEE